MQALVYNFLKFMSSFHYRVFYENFYVMQLPLEILNVMKILGLCPIYKTPGMKNYIIPIIMFLFSFSGATFGTYYVMYARKAAAASESVNTLLLYVIYVLRGMFLTITYYTTACKVESWNALLDITKFHPKDRKSFIHTILVLFVHVVHLFGMVTDGYHNASRKIPQKIRWFHRHVTRYLLNIGLFMAIQFVMVIYIFYNRINDILTQISGKISEENGKDIGGNLISRNMIKEVISRYIQCYNLVGHYNDVFGWPLCCSVMCFVVKFLIDATGLFFNSTSLSELDKLTNILQMILPSVS